MLVDAEDGEDSLGEGGAIEDGHGDRRAKRGDGSPG